MSVTQVTGFRVFFVSMLLVTCEVSAAAEKQGNAGAIGHTRRLNKKDAIVDTSLHRAIQAGDAVLVQTLLDGGANPNAPGARGYRPLWYACMAKESRDRRVKVQQQECVKLLYWAEADDSQGCLVLKINMQ